MSFRFHEIATLTLAMTKFFRCARNESSFGAYLLTECATSKTELEPQRRRPHRTPSLRHTQAHFATITTRCNRLLFGLCAPFSHTPKTALSSFYSRTSSLVFDVREPLCVKYERLRHVVAEPAHKAWWHNKRTTPIYASAECCPPPRGHRGFPCKGER